MASLRSVTHPSPQSGGTLIRCKYATGSKAMTRSGSACVARCGPATRVHTKKRWLSWPHVRRRLFSFRTQTDKFVSTTSCVATPVQRVHKPGLNTVEVKSHAVTTMFHAKRFNLLHQLHPIKVCGFSPLIHDSAL